MRKVLTILTIALTLTIAGTLTASAQQVRQLKVYLKSGVVDTLRVAYGTSISQSFLDLDYIRQNEYTTMTVSTAEGIRYYLLADIDSVVMPKRTVFYGYSDSFANSSGHRTSFSGTFPGTAGTGNVTFYWTENDHIRLDAGDESRASNLTNDKKSASFEFEDLDTEITSYLVYYPDKSVTIPAIQTQTGANNTEHIGRSGDCGMAVATIYDNGNDNVNYSFTLQHKASYLCFLPYIDNLTSARLEKIVVTCSEPIAGTYQLSNSGLYSGTHTSKTITLNLVPQKEQDFLIGHNYQTEQDSCAAYMVVAPQGSDRTFSIAYHVTDTLSRISKVFYQTVSFRPLENTVHPIRFHISDKEFRMVDMGLSVNWLNANVGGTIPSDYGRSFASDEEANAALLEQTVITQWLMPTDEQRNELLDKCQWTWSEYNGILGYMVEGTTESVDDGNLHRIFLPTRSTTPITPAQCLAQNSRAVETLIVDMGLPSGNRWATRNVGAQSATDCGEFYAWGEVETKSEYTPENYKYGTRNLGEDLNISGSELDAAFTHWSGSWRMPTKADWEELLSDTCTWTWTTINSTNGYIVTSKKNGNRIFLPAAGLRYYTGHYHTNSSGVYASSIQGGSNSSYAQTFIYYYDKKGFYASDSYEPYRSYAGECQGASRRYVGKTIRPVMGTGSATSDGMELTILTDSASWHLGDANVTLYGSLRSTTPIKGEVMVGFVVGDSANISVNANPNVNYRYIYSKTTATAGRFTYTLPVYDNIGYWYKSFVQTADTIMYGKARHYGFEMVDLGLSSGTLWANMNLGANSEEEHGNYYAWGETTVKDTYLSSTYQYPTTQNLGDNYNISGTKYDAAHVNMGNAWRLPTYTEMKELYDSCTWTRTTQNSNNGFRVTGKNGNSIFLPDAGLRYDTSLYSDNSGGGYLTATQAGNNSEYAYTLAFDGSRKGIYSGASYEPFRSYSYPYYYLSMRYIGKTVRAVASLGNMSGDNAYTILTDSAQWHLGDTQAMVYGTFSVLRPLDAEVTIGFIIGDSANINLNVNANVNYRYKYAEQTSVAKNFTYTIPVYENMGYWYRSYVQTADTVFLGEAKHFGLEMVDLALPSGTKWCNMNIGASWPEQYGNYYAWAETEIKESYTSGNYRYSTTQNLGNDYSVSGTDMDAAHINMGNVWRLPAKEEAQELLDNCTWTWVLENGVNGYRVTGKNGNSIFLPAAGFRYEDDLYSAETGAVYATSTSGGDGSEYANSLSFCWSRRGIYSGTSYEPFRSYSSPYYYSSLRYMGKSVRAVASPNAVMQNGWTIDIRTDSAQWKMGDNSATLHATVVSKQAISDGLTVGIIIGNLPSVTKATATTDYHKDITQPEHYTTTVSTINNMGYWYRAYVEKDGEVKYGEAKHVGWEMVDLGLPSGTLWANMNYGANTEDQTGKYYAWGETTTKDSYTEENYLYRDSETGVYQTIGNNGDIASTNYDAAFINMGNSWQIPSVAQFNELLNSSYTTWRWSLVNGVKGFIITSKMEGYKDRSIFLPSTGMIKGTELRRGSYSGTYWTQSMGGNSGASAHTLVFNGTGSRAVYSNLQYSPYSTYDTEDQKDAVYRYMGRAIRAVAVQKAAGQ